MKIYLIILSIVLISCNTNSNGQKIKYAIFKNKTFSIFYPDKWIIDTSRKYKVDWAVYSQKESANDKFCENITLAIHDFSQDENNLDSLANQFKDNLNKLGDSSSISKAFMKNDSNAYYKLTYESPKDNHQLKFLQAIWFVNKDLYFFTFTAEKDKFSIYKEEIEEIINSFKSVK